VSKEGYVKCKGCVRIIPPGYGYCAASDTQLDQLADEVIALANASADRDYPWERADLAISLRLGSGASTWTASLGRARVNGASTAVEALSLLLPVVKRYARTTIRGNERMTAKLAEAERERDLARTRCDEMICLFDEVEQRAEAAEAKLEGLRNPST
jgi:hypothetical protein